MIFFCLYIENIKVSENLVQVLFEKKIENLKSPVVLIAEISKESVYSCAGNLQKKVSDRSEVGKLGPTDLVGPIS